jgi:hypothetical protein
MSSQPRLHSAAEQWRGAFDSHDAWHFSIGLLRGSVARQLTIDKRMARKKRARESMHPVSIVRA